MPAAKERLVIEAVVEDEASRALGKINRGLGGSEKGAKRAGTAWAGLGRTIRQVAGPLIGVAAVASVGRLTGSLIRAAAAAEEVESKFQVVFGRNSDSVTASLAQFGDLTGRATTELKRYASSIQDTLVPLGLSRREASSLSVAISKLAVDLGSFNDKAEDEVIRDLQSALVGQTETVRKYGVVINAAAVEQEALRSGLANSKSEITESDKVLARLNLILAGTKDAQGDAARTADSLANSFKKIQATGQQVDELLGMKLAESLGETTTKVDVLTKSSAALKGAFIGVAESITDSFVGALDLLGFASDEFNAEEVALAARAFGGVLPNLSGNPLTDLPRIIQLRKELLAIEKQADERRTDARRRELFADVEFDPAFLAKVARREQAEALLARGIFGLPLAQLQPVIDDLVTEGQRRIATAQERLIRAENLQALNLFKSQTIAGFQVQELRLRGDDDAADRRELEIDFNLFVGQLNELQEKYGDLGKSGATSFRQIEDAARRVLNLQLEAIDNRGAPAQRESVVEIAADARRLREELEETEKARARLVVNEAGRGLASAFTDIAFGIRSADEALKDFLLDFGRLLAQRAFQSLLIGNGDPGSGLFGFLGFSHGGVPPGSLGTIHKAATGMVLPPGPQVAMMNEGPFREAVLPLKRQSDGTLGVSTEGGGGGGAGGMSVFISAVDASSFLSLADRDPEGLASVVLKAINRNPNVRSAFGVSGVSQ